MKRDAWVTLLAGLVPVLAANGALLINSHHGFEACFPYWEGCMSVSRGVRSGPGLWLFKVLAPLAAACMAWAWWVTGRLLQSELPQRARRNRLLTRLGIIGAAFFVVYALWLGTEGEVYRWLRRYGVVFYFGLTGLAQLLLAAELWPRRHTLLAGRLQGPIQAFGVIVLLEWVFGVGSAFKRKLIDDPNFLDRVENALEWNFALAMSLVFVTLAGVLRAADRAR